VYATEGNIAKNTHTEYVILNSFVLQQWLHEHALVLRYTYTDSLVQCSKLVLRKGKWALKCKRQNFRKKIIEYNLMYIGPCIIVIVEE